MESKWINKSWHKQLFIGMHVAKTSQETQLEIQKKLEELDEEMAEIEADLLFSCLKSSKVEERFLYTVRSDISYRFFLPTLLSNRGYSIETRYLPIQLLTATKSTKENELIAKEIVDIIRSSSEESDFAKRMQSYTPTDFKVEDENEDAEDSDDNKKISDVISVCENLAGEMEQVVITLRNGVELKGRIITILQPDKSNRFEGAVYLYTNTGKTVRIVPTDISVIKDDENGNAQFKDIVYPVTKEFREKLYDKILDSFKNDEKV